LILLGWGAWHLLSPGLNSNQPVPPAPVLNPPKPAATPKPQPSPLAQTATPSPAASAAPPTADTSASPSTSTPADQQAATPPPAEGAKTPATSLPPANAASAASPTAESAAGGGAVYGAGNANPRVILRARGDVRITVKTAEGQTILNRDLKPGDSYQVPNVPGMMMATNNAGAIEMDLDGIALGRAGEPQQVLGRVSLDPQSLADRFNNH